MEGSHPSGIGSTPGPTSWPRWACWGNCDLASTACSHESIRAASWTILGSRCIFAASPGMFLFSQDKKGRKKFDGSFVSILVPFPPLLIFFYSFSHAIEKRFWPRILKNFSRFFDKWKLDELSSQLIKLKERVFLVFFPKIGGHSKRQCHYTRSYFFVKKKKRKFQVIFVPDESIEVEVSGAHSTDRNGRHFVSIDAQSRSFMGFFSVYCASGEHNESEVQPLTVRGHFGRRIIGCVEGEGGGPLSEWNQLE